MKIAQIYGKCAIITAVQMKIAQKGKSVQYYLALIMYARVCSGMECVYIKLHKYNESVQKSYLCFIMY